MPNIKMPSVPRKTLLEIFSIVVVVMFLFGVMYPVLQSAKPNSSDIERLSPLHSYKAEQMTSSGTFEFKDNFEADSSLNTKFWSSSDSLLQTVMEYNTNPTATFINPNLGFSNNGLLMSGPDGLYQVTGIQSINSFAGGIIVSVNVTAVAGTSAPAEVILQTENLSNYLFIALDADSSNTPYYGISAGSTSGSGTALSNSVIYSSPSYGVTYNFVVAINNSGLGSVKVLQNGILLGSDSNMPVGLGSFYLTLGQKIGYPTTPVNATEAVWKNISVFSQSSIDGNYDVLFNQTGLPYGIPWYVNLSNGIRSGELTGSTFSAYLPNGTFTYTVQTTNYNFTVDPASGTLKVYGESSSVNITFKLTKILNVGEGIANYPANGITYYADTYHNSVEEFSSSSGALLGSIAVGSRPVSLAIYSNGGQNLLFVVNQLSDNVSVIDLANNQVVGNISVGSVPVGISVLRYEAQIYVTNFQSKNITLIESPTVSSSGKLSVNVIKSISLIGNPTGITSLDAVPTPMYVSLYNLHKVAFLEFGSQYEVLKGYFEAGEYPMGLTLDELGSLFIADSGSNNITIVHENLTTQLATPGCNETSVPTSTDPIGLTSPSNVFFSDEFPIYVSYGTSASSFGELNSLFETYVFSVAATGSSSILPNSQDGFTYLSASGNSLETSYLYFVILNATSRFSGFSVDGAEVSTGFNIPYPLLVPVGTYYFNYQIPAGYIYNGTKTTANISISDTGNIVDPYSLTVAGNGTITIRERRVVNWADSNAFSVLSGAVNLEAIAEFLGINYQIPSGELALITKSSSVAETQFESNLSYYFNITTPGSFSPVGVILVHVPLVPLIDGFFKQSYTPEAYTLSLRGLGLGQYLENHPYIKLTNSGSLNIAVTLSVSKSNFINDLFSTIYSQIKGFITNFFKPSDKSPSDALGSFVNTFDISINIVNSSLSSTGRLSSYELFDAYTFNQIFSNSVNKALGIPSLVMDLIQIPNLILATEEHLEDAAEFSETIIVGAYFSLDAGYDFSAAMILSIHVITTALSYVFPSLNSNNLFEIIENGDNSLMWITDPNGSNALPDVTMPNGTLVLGYNSTDGNFTSESQYGLLYTYGDEYIMFLNNSYNYSVHIDHVGGTSPVPYLMINSLNLSRPSMTLAGSVINNVSANVSLTVSNGSLNKQVVLSPQVTISKEQGYFRIDVESTLSNGSYANAKNGFIVIDSKTIPLIGESPLLYVDVPFNSSLSGQGLIYLSSTYPGGFARFVLPETYAVKIKESGLPAGLSWSINISGIGDFTNPSAMLATYMPNGTYNYTLSVNNSSYEPKNSTGTIHVNGNNISLNVTYIPSKSAVTITQPSTNNLIFEIIGLVAVVGIVGGVIFAIRRFKK
jgi:YVTN family beta-propeller protein